MICTRCKTENPDQARFCSNCGQRLTIVCFNCQTENQPAANFCTHCGQKLSGEQAPGVTQVKSQTKLQQYIPKELLTKLESARAGQSMVGERRVVTILFCDVQGSTAAAENLDPEDWLEIMNGAFEVLIAPIYRYEGTLARLMGDAVLAFFGAPIAHEDDPERAVLAGLDILDGIQPYRERVNARWGIDFNVRVGINTGLVVVGEVGSDLRLEYTAMGDAVNLAARMEQSSEPGTVQITEETYQRVAPLFEIEKQGNVEVKGKAEPVPAYRVLYRKEQPGRLRGIEGLHAPLVGREREMRDLQAALANLEQGFGGIVCLIGEAGLGKSRLIEETRTSWLDKNGTGDRFWYESRGVSYETSRPYSQFQQLFHAISGANEADSQDQLRQKIAKCLAELKPEERSPAIQAFEVLMGADHQLGETALEGEALKWQLYEANLNLWRWRIQAGPTVLVFEDMHWSDRASIELFLHLLQLTDSGPLLFLCALRPDRAAPSWGAKLEAETNYPHRYHEITLRPLTAGDSQSLVNHLLTIAQLPPRLRKLILQKSEGNPFFVEEVVRSLIDSGVLVRDELNGRWVAAAPIEDISLPDNLQSLLLARIDRLEEADRRTLQLAAVIGRSFYYRVLKSIHETATELDRHLWALLRTELIREAAREPELEYIFRHALTQEAAYRSILRKERQKFHLRVAKALEELFAERQEELVPLLAHHYFEAGDPRSLDYCVRAGDSAFRMYALPEACEHYQRALQSTNLAEMDAATLEHIYSKWGRSLELMAEWEQALAVYEELESQGEKLGNRYMELTALTARAVIHSTANRAFNATEGAQLQERALALARELGDQAAEAKILWTMLLRNTMTGGNLQKRIQYGEQSLALARRLNLQEQIAFTLHDMWFAYSGAGQWEELRAALDESKRIWSQSGNLPMLSENLTRTHFAQMATGDLEAAIATFEEAFRVAEQANNMDGQATSSSLVGRAFFERGDFEQAISVMAKSIAIGEPLNNLTTLTMTQADLGWAYGWLGMPERGIQLATQGHQAAKELFPAALDWTASTLIRLFLLTADLDKAEELLENLGDFHEQSEKFGFLAPQWVGIALAKGEWSLVSQDFDQTIAVVEHLVTLLRERGVRLFYPEALYLLGKAKLASGAVEKAFDVLSQAHGEAERWGFTRILLPISLSLNEAAIAVGKREDGVQFHDQAARLAHDLAGKISEPDLRRAFLKQHLATEARRA